MAPCDTNDDTVPSTVDPIGCSETKVKNVNGSFTAGGGPARRRGLGSGASASASGATASTVATSMAARTSGAVARRPRPRRLRELDATGAPSSSATESLGGFSALVALPALAALVALPALAALVALPALAAGAAAAASRVLLCRRTRLGGLGGLPRLVGLLRLRSLGDLGLFRRLVGRGRLLGLLGGAPRPSSRADLGAGRADRGVENRGVSRTCRRVAGALGGPARRGGLGRLGGGFGRADRERRRLRTPAPGCGG